MCDNVVTSVCGHLMETDFAESHRKWSSCAPLDLFDAPVVKFIPEKNNNIKRTLQEQARRLVRNPGANLQCA